ncbi:unnamed protein product [Rotaria socialis]|uniref:Uncharacterized protein n=1 Tax=Rotaria socialis TaxID=392032 RepID=A0A818H885_9BILA|nr:unnamed protein product [Rotaria socialis]
MRRQDSLEKEIMLGMIGGKRRRGRQKKRWIDTITEDTHLTLTQLNSTQWYITETYELDSQLVRLGVFKSNEESAAPGSKFLTQAYDGIHNESHGTGVAKHVIADGKLAIFGASTGQRYAFNMQVLLFYQRERKSFVDGDVLPTFYKLVPPEKIRTKRRNIDIESDGSTLSANALLNRLIKEDIAKSGDVNRPPHVRALYVKRAQKLSRIIANTHLYLTTIYLLTSNDFDLFNCVSFREGSETVHSIE